MNRSTAVLASILLLTLPASLRAQTAETPAADQSCPAATIDVGSLPRSKDAIAKAGEFNIVAFGSSSTAGWMSSDAGHSYPAVMQQALELALPHAHVSIINRGIGGQDAPEEVARIDEDVTSLRPSLVIWQVGANGALRNTDPEVFRSLVASGLERLRRARVDVILMDNQRSPMILAASQSQHTDMNSVLADLSRDAHVGLFSRSRLMDIWREEGAGYDLFVSSDGLHHNDRGYRCLGLAIAQSVVNGLNAVQAPVLVSTALPPTAPRAPAPGNTAATTPGQAAAPGDASAGPGAAIVSK